MKPLNLMGDAELIDTLIAVAKCNTYGTQAEIDKISLEIYNRLQAKPRIVRKNCKDCPKKKRNPKFRLFREDA